MAYAIIEFLESTTPRATLVRLDNGEPTGKAGVMNLLGEFINSWGPKIMAEGSPGAVKMAMLFTAQEQEAERPLRVLGGEGELGITAEQVRKLEGTGYLYEVDFGAPGDRTMPSARSRAISEPEA